jgi:hypothetical protein
MVVEIAQPISNCKVNNAFVSDETSQQAHGDKAEVDMYAAHLGYD